MNKNSKYTTEGRQKDALDEHAGEDEGVKGNKTFDLKVLPLRSAQKPLKPRRELDPRLPDAHTGVNMLIVAPPKCGKSVLLCNLVLNSQFYKEYFENVYIISPTIAHDKSLRNASAIYQSTTYDHYSDSVINQIKKYQLSFDEEERPNACVILDDCLAMKSFSKRNNAVQRLSSNYRHILSGAEGGGMLIFSTQKLTSLPPSLRSCANTIVLGKTGNMGQRKKMAEEWGDSFGGEHQFNDMMDYATAGRFNFLVIHLEGNGVYDNPVAYKNWDELIFPTPRFPEPFNKYEHQSEKPPELKEEEENNDEI